jgi:hypothetical protein
MPTGADTAQRQPTSGTMGWPVLTLCSGACTWNTVWWKSVYALDRAPVPSSPSRFLLPRNVTCSTTCANPCSSCASSTDPTTHTLLCHNLILSAGSPHQPLAAAAVQMTADS